MKTKFTLLVLAYFVSLLLNSCMPGASFEVKVPSEIDIPQNATVAVGLFVNERGVYSAPGEYIRNSTTEALVNIKKYRILEFDVRKFPLYYNTIPAGKDYQTIGNQ